MQQLSPPAALAPLPSPAPRRMQCQASSSPNRDRGRGGLCCGFVLPSLRKGTTQELPTPGKHRARTGPSPALHSCCSAGHIPGRRVSAVNRTHTHTRSASWQEGSERSSRAFGSGDGERAARERASERRLGHRTAPRGPGAEPPCPY